MANKKSSKLRRLSVFANSPKVVRIFGALLITLAAAASGYGIYTLLDQESGEAANSNIDTWYHNSSGIWHSGGKRSTYLSKAVWASNQSDRGKVVWWGPYKALEAGQYIGCFYYAFPSDDNYSSATLDILNTVGDKQTVLHKHKIRWDQPGGSNSFRKTCLAFYVPPVSWPRKNLIELRVTHEHGYLYILKTKISRISSQKNELSNQWLLRKERDNLTITHNYGYKE